MNISLILEVVVAGLLVVTAAYCFVLDRRLRALRTGQDGLKAVIEGLDAATERAQTSILQLKVVGEQTSKKLDEDIAKARILADELSVMIESGDNIADRLAGSVDETRARKAEAETVVAAPAGDQEFDLHAAMERLSKAASEMVEDTSRRQADIEDPQPDADLSSKLASIR